MTAPRVTLNGAWTGFQGVNGDDAAANAGATDPVTILDAVEVPIVVVRRDFRVACFNQAGADGLGLLPSDIGRLLRDISVLADSTRLEQQCDEVIAGGVDSHVDLRSKAKWFAVRISPYLRSDRGVAGTVLTFTDVTAFRASIGHAVYERECTKTILNTVRDPLVVLSTDHRIQSGNRAFYTIVRGLPRGDARGSALTTRIWRLRSCRVA